MNNGASAIIKSWEQREYNLGRWITTFLAIVIVRDALEQWSSHRILSAVTPDWWTLVHYALFYLSLSLAIILITSYASAVPPRVLINGILFVLPIIWLAPVVDLLISRGEGIGMAYILTSVTNLVAYFFTFFGPFVDPGITPGIRFEVLLILLGAFILMHDTTKKISRALLGTIALYSIIFLWVSFPSLFNNVPQDAYAFNILMSKIWFLAATILSTVFFARAYPKVTKAILQNMRYERTLHYLLLFIIGLLLGRATSVMMVDGLSIIVLAVSITCAWLSAVHVNDIADIDIDRITNPNRPLITGSVTQQTMQHTTALFAGWALLGSALQGSSSFFFMLLFLAAYFVYSAQPLRLKRAPLLATLLIAIACSAILMMGFFARAQTSSIRTFPAAFLALILLGYTLGGTVKDLKDIPGDRADGIRTLPVLFGERRGKHMTCMLAVASFIAVPLMLRESILWLTALPASAAIVHYIYAAPYREKPIFVVYFLFIATSAVLLPLTA